MSRLQQEAAGALIALQAELTPIVKRDPVRGDRIRRAMHELSVAVLKLGPRQVPPGDPLALLKVALDAAYGEGADWHEIADLERRHQTPDRSGRRRRGGDRRRACCRGTEGRNTVKETGATIAGWAAATFGPAHDPARVAARANEEMAELLRAATSQQPPSKLIEEAADVVIVLARLVHVAGGDIWQAVERKMEVNRARVWKKDGTGHGYHVREKEADQVERSVDQFLAAGKRMFEGM